MSTTILHISFAELCNLENIESHVIIDMIGNGIITPVQGVQEADWVFETSTVRWIKKAARLATDFEIDWIAVSLVIDLMQQKERLERQNEAYRLQLRRFIEN